MPTAPLFDMSKAQPLSQGGAPLFDMSKAKPLAGANPDPNNPAASIPNPSDPKSSANPINQALTRDPGLGESQMPGASEGAGLREGLGEYVDRSGGDVVRGAGSVARGSIAKGTHQILSGAMNAATPALPFAAAAAPAAVARGAIAGAMGGTVAKSGAEAFGATPDQADVAGDVGGIAGAGLGAGSTRSPRLGRLLDAAKEEVHIPVIGKVSKYAEAWKGPKPDPVYPGASEPTAPPGVLQAAPLSRGGGKPVSSPSDALGKLSVPPVYPGAHLPEAPPPITNFWHGPDEYPVTNQLHGPEAPEPITNFFHGQPEAPSPELLNSRALSQPGAAAREPSAGLGQLPVPRGSISKAMQPQQPPIQRGSLQELLQQSLGGKALQSNVPLRNQVPPRGSIANQMKSSIAETPAAEQFGSTSIPEGHTAVDSSALRSYKYDPEAREFHAQYKNSDKVHIFGDVSPEEAQAFESAPSKGKAMPAIARNPEVARIINGKRVTVPRASTSSQ